MGRLVKISPYRTGEPRFGTREHKPFDNSVKTYKLSPEELAKYQDKGEKKEEKKVAVAEKKVRKGPGRPRGSSITVSEYVELSKSGLLDKEIAAKKGMLPTSLANWKAKNKTEIESEMAKVDEEEMVEKLKYDKLQREYEGLKNQLEEKLKTHSVGPDYEKMYVELSKDYEKLVYEAEEAEAKVAKLEDEISILKAREKQLEQDVINVDYQRQEYEEAYKEFSDELDALRKLTIAHLQKAVNGSA